MESTSLLTIDTVSKIQKELDSYDRRSLVFLLYDNPVIALQRITENDEALKQWAMESSQNHNWQEKFIESLAICKLYGVIKKLGFDISQVKSRYSPQIIDTSVYVDPVRKLFYLTSEQMTNEDLNTIKNNIGFDLNAEDAYDFEIIILEVMCKGKKMEKLLNAMSKIPLLTTFLLQIRERISDRLLSELSVNDDDAFTSRDEIDSSNTYYEFTDSDRIINQSDYYPIKNPQKVGLAYLINQQLFNHDVENPHKFPNRDGSNVDKIILKQTLEKLNFTCFVADNLISTKILPSIANIVKTKFEGTHSIFILCILSHGVVGQIFGTDCIPVKVKEVQKAIDSAGREKLKNIPKVIFLQACQSVDKFVADAPLAKDYLIHWATSPEYEAYRSDKTGSIFIQVLCRILAVYGQKDHLVNICTRVNNYVIKICSREDKLQLPIIKTTLTKKLYLSSPI